MTTKQLNSACSKKNNNNNNNKYEKIKEKCGRRN